VTDPSGVGDSGAALDPQSRADLGKPQGLKSAPQIPNPDYPHLGFRALWPIGLRSSGSQGGSDARAVQVAGMKERAPR